MSGWKTFKNVTISDVFKNVSYISNHYRIVLSKKADSGYGNDYFTIDIQQTDLKEHLDRLIKGVTSREYFAFGMTNIDIYNRGNTFVIDHSPFDGHHDEYVLKKGELEKLVQTLSLLTKREDELEDKVKQYEKALEEILRQYDGVSVNRAKEIANKALGELTDERRKEIQSY